MPSSSFSWLDNSERDRRRALDVIDLLRQQDTRDQLGIGTVRDSLSDVLAPGTSTIQTRARYFLFIPWVYQRLEKRKIDSATIAQRDRDAELDLAKRLGQADDAVGAIGAEAGKGLKRLASAVYWAGLGTLGVRIWPGSQDQYHRALDRFYEEESRGHSRQAETEGDLPVSGRWHPHLPVPPDGFPSGVDFRLTGAEAIFLQDRIRTRAPQTAFSFLVGWSGDVHAAPAWWADGLMEAYPEKIRSDVEHARCFSEKMHGAALLYNLMLARELPHEERAEEYASRLAAWQSTVEERADAHAAWDRDAFWRLIYETNARIPPSSRRFSEKWIELTESTSFHPANSKAAQDLVRRREIQLKRGRARLAHREYLLMWGGSAGAEPLDYRWTTVRTLIGDVVKGLGGSGDHARTG